MQTVNDVLVGIMASGLDKYFKMKPSKGGLVVSFIITYLDNVLFLFFKTRLLLFDLLFLTL